MYVSRILTTHIWGWICVEGRELCNLIRISERKKEKEPNYLFIKRKEKYNALRNVNKNLSVVS